MAFTIPAACDAADEAVLVPLDDVRQPDDAPLHQPTCAYDVADEAVHVLLDDWDDAPQ